MTDKKFQWSKFKNSKDEQFVVRSDSWEEFQEDIERVQDKFFDFAQQMEEPRNPEIEESLSDDKLHCKEHNTPMKLNKNGKPYHRKFENGQASFCNGYGWS